MNDENLISPICRNLEYMEPKPNIDTWEPKPEDLLIRECKGYTSIPISEFYGMEETTGFDNFDLSKKRSYNNNKFRPHYERYINYFIKYFDTDKELLYVYGQMKMMMTGEYSNMYTKTAFMHDLERLFFRNASLRHKIKSMNDECYNLVLSVKPKKDLGIQYTTRHGKMLMELSVIMTAMIPIITQYLNVYKVQNVYQFILSIYDKLLVLFDADIYSKLFETCRTMISKNENDNPIWENQDIRSISSITHTHTSIENLLLSVLPRYQYDGNMISLNYSSILRNTGYQITDIGYDYDFVSLSSSNRDEDNNSEFDKFEAGLTKQSESLYIQNKINCQQTMKRLESMYPVSTEEVEFYLDNLGKNPNIKDSFQEDLVFYLFYKYFGDVYGVRETNLEDYVKLMIIGKRMLLENNRMTILPYIYGGRVVRIVPRKNLNRREAIKLQSSKLYDQVMSKYLDEKTQQYAHTLIGTIVSSEFEIIDYNIPDIHGCKIEINPDKLAEEILTFIDLI